MSVTQLSARHVAQVGPRREVDRRGELGRNMMRKIEVEVEPREVPTRLPLCLVNQRLRKEHPAGLVMRMRQREKSLGPQIFRLDLGRRHTRQRFPRCASLELHANAVLARPFRAHRDTFRRAIGQIVPHLEQSLMAIRDLWFLLLEPFHQTREILTFARVLGPP